ncbi:hypothetical protein [Magnetospirillum molischianum]|nr:hypothetical protein [Magnetospirillum molischianum]
MTFGSGGWALPIDPGSVLRDGSGKALPLADGTTQFDFRYRDIRFAARVEVDHGSVTLRVVGDVGPMPYSAESTQARAGLTRICAVANESLVGARLRVAQGRILLGKDITLETPPTATALVSAVVEFILPTRPYLELISVYLRPPLAPARAGETALQPQWRKPSR